MELEVVIDVDTGSAHLEYVGPLSPASARDGNGTDGNVACGDDQGSGDDPGEKGEK